MTYNWQGIFDSDGFCHLVCSGTVEADTKEEGEEKVKNIPIFKKYNIKVIVEEKEE